MRGLWQLIRIRVALGVILLPFALVVGSLYALGTSAPSSPTTPAVSQAAYDQAMDDSRKYDECRKWAMTEHPEETNPNNLCGNEYWRYVDALKVIDAATPDVAPRTSCEPSVIDPDHWTVCTKYDGKGRPGPITTVPVIPTWNPETTPAPQR
jgi:hypothetical protein